MKAFLFALALATCVVSLPTKSQLSQEELRASLITKDNVAEYLQNQRIKKAMEQAKLPEPFVIRLLDSAIRSFAYFLAAKWSPRQF